MYLVPVSVFAAGNGTIVVIAQDTSKKQIAAPIYVDNELMGTGKVTLTLPAKKHKVKFGDMEGYAIVSPRSGKKKVLVKAGKTTTVKGTYQASTGTYTASGTYTWNSTKGKLTVNWTTTDFVCEGPELGTETKTGVTITATTMTWPEDGNDNNDMTWSRSSGTSGDIVGTWTASDSTTGNSWTVTFNADGTVSGVGNIVKCGDDGGGGENPKAEAQNWSSGYIVQLRYSDEKETATSVSVTGHGINGSVTLTYNKGMGSWGSGTSESQISFGTTYPTGLPYTYTFSITDTTGTWTATSTVSCFQEQFVSNISPTGTVSGTPTFSWTGINDSNARYGVQVNDSNGNWLWANYYISGTSIVYNGPALTPGKTYGYAVSVESSSACSNPTSGGGSYVGGSFTYQ